MFVHLAPRGVSGIRRSAPTVPRASDTWTEEAAVEMFAVNRHEAAAGAVRLEVDMTVSAQLTAAQLREIEDAVVAGLVVDLHGVSFLDSTGIAALVAGMRAARQRRVPFTVINPQHQVRMVLEVTGLLGALSGDDGAPWGGTGTENTSGTAGH